MIESREKLGVVQVSEYSHRRRTSPRCRSRESTSPAWARAASTRPGGSRSSRTRSSPPAACDAGGRDRREEVVRGGIEVEQRVLHCVIGEHVLRGRSIRPTRRSIRSGRSPRRGCPRSGRSARRGRMSGNEQLSTYSPSGKAAYAPRNTGGLPKETRQSGSTVGVADAEWPTHVSVSESASGCRRNRARGRPPNGGSSRPRPQRRGRPGADHDLRHVHGEGADEIDRLNRLADT